MAKVSVYNVKGEEIEQMELSESVFGLEANHTLVHQVYVAMMANARGVYAHTKTRGDVSGTGKKPWKQKGTGRARVGSVRNPAWRGGGVVFGPRNDRNYSQKINKKMRRKAFLVALSEKFREGKIMIFDALQFPEQKTKLVAASLQGINVAGKSVVLCLSEGERDVALASRNIPRLNNVLTQNLNVVDLLNYQYLVLSKESIKVLEQRFSEQEAEA